MSNKVAASMTASIIIDKKEVISSALAAYASAQKEIDGNKLELLVDVSDDEALKRLKEIQKELSGKDYIIKFKNQGIDETLKSLDELYEKIKAIISGKNLGNGKISLPIKETFQGDAEAEEMKKVATATDEAVQEKKDFAIANKGVQDSVDDSKSKLELEANLMKSIAENAEKAAKAEKELQRQQEKSNAEKLKEEENKKIAKQKENYDELNRVIDRYSTVRKRIANGNSLSSDKQEVKDLKESIDNLHKTDLLSEEQFKNAKIRLDNLETSVKDIIALTRQSAFDSMQSDIDSYYKRLNSLKIKPSEIDRSPRYTKALDEYKDAIDKLEKRLAILRNTTEEFTEKDKKDWENLTNSVQEAYDKIKSFSAAQKGSSVHSREKEIDKLTKYLKENTKISKTARKELENYLNILKNGGASVNVQEIHTEWTKVAVAEREAGREGKAFFDILGDKTLYGYAAQLAGYYLSLMDFVRYARAVFDNVVEINTAQTELRKVSDATESRLTENFKTSAKAAKDLGATITDVISATADWSKMGYSVDDSETLARISTLYKNVGDGIDIEAANNSLISTLQGFQLSADEAEGVIDKFNEVAKILARLYGNIRLKLITISVKR